MTNESLYAVLGRRLEILFAEDAGGSVDTRAFMRNYALGMFLQSPVVGYGMNGFAIQMGAINYHLQAYSHCNFTELLACYGLVGFLIYYSLTARFLSQVSLRDKDGRSFCAFVLAITAAFLIKDYGSVSYYSVDTYYLYALILGMMSLHNCRQQGLPTRSFCYLSADESVLRVGK